MRITGNGEEFRKTSTPPAIPARPPQPGPRMAIRFRTSGCLFSIIASVVLTILLNLMLRGCSM